MLLRRTTHSWRDLRVKSSYFWLPSSNLGLASIEVSFDIVASEVIGSTIPVDTVRGEPRTWFALVDVASPFGISSTPM